MFLHRHVVGYTNVSILKRICQWHKLAIVIIHAFDETRRALRKLCEVEGPSRSTVTGEAGNASRRKVMVVATARSPESATVRDGIVA